MPLVKVPFKPGFNKQMTQSSAEYTWTDGDFVRFRYGEPEKIGGWEKTSGDTVAGVTRDIHNWSDLDGNRYLAIATHRLLVIYYGRAFYDITPLDTALTSCTYTTTNNSATLTVNKTAHGLAVGDLFTFSNMTIPGSGTGFVATDFTTNTFEVVTVATDTFTVTMSKVESGAGVTGATGCNVNPYVKFGPAIATPGYGYGVAQWGGQTISLTKNDLDGALGDNTAGTGGSGTAVSLTSTSGFSTAGHILVGSELITYTGISSNDLTGITRGALGSTRAAHDDAAVVTDATNFVAWGNAAATTDVTLDPANWALDNFGEILVGTVKNKKTFEWSPSSGLTTRATVSSNNPTASVMTLVSGRDRHLIHLGTETTVGTASTQDKLFIRFSDQEDRTDYTPVSTNTAGTFRLDSGTKIEGAVRAKDYILILTDTAAYTMQFVGPPFTFNIQQVGSNCGLIGQHAIVHVDGIVYWMGQGGGFFAFDGTVKRIPCSVEDFVFTNVDSDDLGINYDAGEIVYCNFNSLFTEINWFYPKAGSSQIDRCVTLNYREGAWTTSSLARTAYMDKTLFERPIASEFTSTGTPTFPTIQGVSNTNGASQIYEHEKGVNQADQNGNATASIDAFIESGDFTLDSEGAQGENFIKIRRFLPDFKILSGNATVTIQLKDFPAETEASSLLGPFTVSSSTKKIDTRARGRFASLKIENTSTDQNWRFGSFRADVQPDGRR
tara:strand:- start:639 stop:2807 length:2169 start_codon:yes stop_codon:yes gene_type:complete